MTWDLGPQGLAVMAGLSLGVGALVQMVTWRWATHWLWLIAAGACFAVGLFTSEIWFGWATEKELQPNIDGLSYDEALLSTFVVGLLTVAVSWSMSHRRGRPAGLVH